MTIIVFHKNWSSVPKVRGSQRKNSHVIVGILGKGDNILCLLTCSISLFFFPIFLSNNVLFLGLWAQLPFFPEAVWCCNSWVMVRIQSVILSNAASTVPVMEHHWINFDCNYHYHSFQSWDRMSPSSIE